MPIAVLIEMAYIAWSDKLLSPRSTIATPVVETMSGFGVAVPVTLPQREHSCST